jgi:hypothetical protein
LLAFVFQDINNVDIVRLYFIRWLSLLILSGLSCVPYNLTFSNLIFSWSCHYLFGVLIRSIEVWILLFLIHKSSNLLLRTLEEFVYLALSLMLDWIISSLDSWWIYRVVSSSTACAFCTTSHLNTRLRSRWAWRRCSNLSLVTLLGILHILALNIFRLFIIFVIIDNYSELIKFIKATVWVLLTSPFFIVTLCSFLDLIVINKLSINTRMVFIIKNIFEWVLRFLLLWVMLLSVVVGVSTAGQVIDRRCCVIIRIIPKAVIIVLILFPSRITFWILRLFHFVLVNVFLILVEIRVVRVHIVIVLRRNSSSTSTDVRISWLFSSVIKGILCVFLVCFFLLYEFLRFFLIEFMTILI